MNPGHIESLLLHLIVQLVLIIAAARMAGSLFRFFGQPQVCGEIAAGLILGPSALGALFPHWHQMVFAPEAAPHMSVLSQIGLIFLMFLIGLDFDFDHLRSSSHAALMISAAGILVPFGLGQILAPWVYSQMNLHVSRLGFALFVSTALSITAIPILGRIMIEFNINRTRLGALTITASAIDDAVGWLLLATVSAIVRSELHVLRLSLSAIATIVYLLFMIFAVRPLMKRWVRWVMRDSKGELSLNALAQVLIFLFTSAAVTNLIGIFSIFGAFVMGAILYDQADFREAVGRRLRDFVVAFFLPIFFTFTGLRTDVGSLHGGMAWLICGALLLAATVGKFGTCTVAARMNGLSWHEAGSVGIMMNTRALMELIVLNTGYDLGIIPRTVFSMLVIMAIVTTYMTAPILSRLIQRTDLQAHFQDSQFMRGRLAPFWTRVGAAASGRQG